MTILLHRNLLCIFTCTCLPHETFVKTEAENKQQTFSCCISSRHYWCPVLKTTDKEEGYIPYMEKLAKEKELEKQNEQELPTIKSFKD